MRIESIHEIGHLRMRMRFVERVKETARKGRQRSTFWNIVQNKRQNRAAKNENIVIFYCWYVTNTVEWHISNMMQTSV